MNTSSDDISASGGSAQLGLSTFPNGAIPLRLQQHIQEQQQHQQQQQQQLMSSAHEIQLQQAQQHMQQRLQEQEQHLQQRQQLKNPHQPQQQQQQSQDQPPSYNMYNTEKSFICEICGKAFRFRSNLAEHRSVHTALKPYVCKYCGKSSRLKGNLTKHILKHHKQETNAVVGREDIIIKKGKKSVKDPKCIDFLEKSMIVLTQQQQQQNGVDINSAASSLTSPLLSAHPPENYPGHIGKLESSAENLLLDATAVPSSDFLSAGAALGALAHRQHQQPPRQLQLPLTSAHSNPTSPLHIGSQGFPMKPQGFRDSSTLLNSSFDEHDIRQQQQLLLQLRHQQQLGNDSSLQQQQQQQQHLALQHHLHDSQSSVHLPPNPAKLAPDLTSPTSLDNLYRSYAQSQQVEPPRGPTQAAFSGEGSAFMSPTRSTTSEGLHSHSAVGYADNSILNSPPHGNNGLVRSQSGNTLGVLNYAARIAAGAPMKLQQHNQEQQQQQQQLHQQHQVSRQYPHSESHSSLQPQHPIFSPRQDAPGGLLSLSDAAMLMQQRQQKVQGPSNASQFEQQQQPHFQHQVLRQPHSQQYSMSSGEQQQQQHQIPELLPASDPHEAIKQLCNNIFQASRSNGNSGNSESQTEVMINKLSAALDNKLLHGDTSRGATDDINGDKSVNGNTNNVFSAFLRHCHAIKTNLEQQQQVGGNSATSQQQLKQHPLQPVSPFDNVARSPPPLVGANHAAHNDDTDSPVLPQMLPHQQNQVCMNPTGKPTTNGIHSNGDATGFNKNANILAGQQGMNVPGGNAFNKTGVDSGGTSSSYEDDYDSVSPNHPKANCQRQFGNGHVSHSPHGATHSSTTPHSSSESGVSHENDNRSSPMTGDSYPSSAPPSTSLDLTSATGLDGILQLPVTRIRTAGSTSSRTGSRASSGTQCLHCGKHFRKSSNLEHHMKMKHAAGRKRQRPYSPPPTGRYPPASGGSLRPTKSTEPAAKYGEGAAKCNGFASGNESLRMKSMERIAFHTGLSNGFTGAAASPRGVVNGQDTGAKRPRHDPTITGEQLVAVSNHLHNNHQQLMETTNECDRQNLPVTAFTEKVDLVSGCHRDILEIKQLLSDVKQAAADRYGPHQGDTGPDAKTSSILGSLDVRVTRVERQMEASMSTLSALIQSQTAMSVAINTFRTEIIRKISAIAAKDAAELLDMSETNLASPQKQLQIDPADNPSVKDIDPSKGATMPEQTIVNGGVIAENHKSDDILANPDPDSDSKKDISKPIKMTISLKHNGYSNGVASFVENDVNMDTADNKSEMMPLETAIEAITKSLSPTVARATEQSTATAPGSDFATSLSTNIAINGSATNDATAATVVAPTATAMMTTFEAIPAALPTNAPKLSSPPPSTFSRVLEAPGLPASIHNKQNGIA